MMKPITRCRAFTIRTATGMRARVSVTELIPFCLNASVTQTQQGVCRNLPKRAPAKTDTKARRRELRDGLATGEIRPSSAIHIYLETVVDAAAYLCGYSGWRAFESA